MFSVTTKSSHSATPCAFKMRVTAPIGGYAAPQPTLHQKVRGDRRVQGVAHVGDVGDRAHQGHAAGRFRIDAFGDEIARVYQQASRDALVEAMALEIARAERDLHQLAGGFSVDSGFMRN